MRFLRMRSSRASARRGQRRRRVVPLWRARITLASAGAAGLVAMIGFAWWTWTSGVAPGLAGQVGKALIGTTADLGLTVEEVFVVGRRETPRHQLLDALGVERGSPIVALDIGAARQRLLALPWIREASVERLLPDAVVVRVRERQALALWQNQGEFSLIDNEGGVVQHRDLARFAHLLVVVGDDAPTHARELIAMLERQPDLRGQVEAAVRVSGRRWNLRLAGGIDVRLPEEDVEGAWARLAEYERLNHVLARDVHVVDLRFDNQVIVRPISRQKEQTATEGQET